MPQRSFQILTAPSQVEPHVEQVINLADANKKALGFLQKSVFREKANQGRLWIAVSSDEGKCIGYLLFGGRYPVLRVFQLFIQKPYRKLGIGKGLITDLVNWGTKYNYLNIIARVAADLPSNRFWEQVDFVLIRQEPGGKSAGRMINILVKELDTPSLLNVMSYETSDTKTGIQHIRLENRPVVGVPTYVLDLNIFFDIIKKRIHRAEAARLINAGLNQQDRLIVTPEFVRELERNSPQGRQDPVLEFARTLPVLPEIPITEINGLLCELSPQVFPEVSPSGRNHVQSVSDLTHLAYCIHHRITGFVTREKDTLAASEQLQEAYFLEVLSPADLIQPSISISRRRGTLHANLGTQRVLVSYATEAERGEVESFLVTRGVSRKDLATIWDPGSTSLPRRRVIARVGANLIAAASWDSPSKFSCPSLINLYVEETSFGAETVIDHVLEVALRDAQPLAVSVVTLDAPIDQAKTRTTAEKRGFLRSFPGGMQPTAGKLCKLTFNGLISSKNWSEFRRELEKATRLRLPMRIPTFEEFNHTGIVIKNQSNKLICKLNLFDFETLVSPGIVLCPGRSAIIVPIKLRFAKGLFAYVQAQRELFPAPEALLHVEKAYFRNTRGVSQFTVGALVLFYLSGSGGGTKEVIGCARVTYSDVLSLNGIEWTLERQGVLSRSELENIANSSGKMHVFTFDNYNAFPIRIPFSFLKNRNMISGANLITAEQLSSKNCAQVCEYGFDLRNRADE